MGKSILGDIAGIFMQSYANEFVLDPKKNNFVPIFWKREVDDVYCLGRTYLGFLRLSEWVLFKNKMDYRSRERRKALIC